MEMVKRRYTWGRVRAIVALAMLTGVVWGAPATAPGTVWSANLDGALVRAGNEFRPVLVVFSSPDCPWCVRLKSETLADPAVQSALETFICVTVDTSRDPAAARTYQLRGVPASVILSADGRVQALAEGFMDKGAYTAFLDDYRKGGGRRTDTSGVANWLKCLQGGAVSNAPWPEIMAGLGNKEARSRLHEALLGVEPCPRREWVALLRHARLAVRLGAIEILEEKAGVSFGYDPWAESAANTTALERWNGWAAGGSNETARLFAPLTEEQIGGYIRDLASGDRDRGARAVRMLEQGGATVIPVLEAWLAASATATEEARRRVREVRYYLLLPDELGTERSRLVHRLVFGNQDERVRSIPAVAVAGESAMPVIMDVLADPDPLIRETAVDALISAGRNAAIPGLLEVLKSEKDEEVVHAVIRGAGNLKGAKAVELIGPYAVHSNEDLAVAALLSLGRTKAAAAAGRLKESLNDSRWRVRAAGLEAIGKARSSGLSDDVAARLDDSDAFVRRTAVLTLTALSSKKSSARLSELFVREDSLKGPILAALRQMDIPLPESFGAALKGKDADILLPVMEALGDGGGDTWRLALPYLSHANGDVACAAIRVVARGGGRTPAAETELAKVLRDGNRERVLTVFESYRSDRESSSYSSSLDSGDTEEFEQLVAGATSAGSTNAASAAVPDALASLFAAFAPESAGTAVATAAPPAAATLQDVFGAFGEAVPETPPLPAVPSDESRAISIPAAGASPMVSEAMAYLDPAKDSEIRFMAALMLMSVGNPTGMTFLVESLATRTADERLTVAKRVRNCRSETVIPLVKRLLRDTSADVRQEAVAACLSDAIGPSAVRELFVAVFEPGAVLMPADLFKESYAWYQAVRRAGPRREIGVAVRRALAADGASREDGARRVLALTLLDSCWKEGDQALVKPYLADTDPFVRRAAWYSFGKHQQAAFTGSLATVARDTSEWVRAVVPAVYTPEGSSSWSVYFNAETATEGISSFSSGGTRRKLPRPVVESLVELSRDRSPVVGSAAAICLFANREKADLRALRAMLGDGREGRVLAYRLYQLLRDVPVAWLREMDTGEVLSLIDAVMTPLDDDDGSRLDALRKQLVSKAVSGLDKREIVLRKGGEANGATQGVESVTSTAMGAPDAAGPRRVVFFRNPGCRDCARVAELLGALRAEFKDLVVEEKNIRNPDDARLNEALCDRFNVPDRFRLTAPAVFCGAGDLIKGEITFESLGRLLSRTEALQSAWREVGEAALAKADTALGGRYSSLGVWIIVGAGLLDGLNPCAFATIIFLLSYLQITRRSSRETLAVGGAFVAGVFIAYFLLGLGLVEVVARLDALRRAGQLMNAGMAVFVAVIAGVSVWDGVQCLRGRMGDMVLQLPGALKRRIHTVVRQSARQRRFVIAAFAAGAAVAVLELACTGQVYAPTLLYMVKTGRDRIGAIAYLALYNVAFVVPLLVVFAGTYGGLGSERLTEWLQRRAALVKFATAGLFAVLFALLVAGFLKTGVGI